MRAIYDPSPASVYRCYDVTGDLLYIGCSVNVKKRVNNHRQRSEWFADVTDITEDHYPTKADAMNAEALAIMAERPRYNIRYNRAASKDAA